MRRSRPHAFLASVATAAPAPSKSTTAPSTSATVRVANSRLGRIVVDSSGRTLYRFIKDKQPGQTTGQGVTAFGAAWYVLAPAGNQISAQQPSSGGNAGSGGGYGY
jgi:predicted lipoprotein with Yx(FWY)xxD motif